ncbi:MAG: hypothetical protein E6R03_01235, partial [Hyphomicrobiaceae bacterium]
MPPVAAAAVAGLVGGITIEAGVLGFSFASAALAAGGSLLVSGLSAALAPKQKKAAASSAAQALDGGLTTTVRQAIAARPIVYGEARVGGTIIFFGTTENNKYLHMVVALAGHEVEEIGEVWLDDTPIPPDHLDAGGNVISASSPYKGVVRIKKLSGNPNQTADSDLVAAGIGWTSAHRLRGTAGIYLRMLWNQDKFTGLPNVSAWVRGARLYDPRTGGFSWTPNAALAARDYIGRQESLLTPGIGASGDEIDDTATVAAANICDETVATKNEDFTVSSVDVSGDRLTLNGDRLTLMSGDRVRVLTTGSAPGGLATGTDYYVIPYQRKDTPRIRLAASYDDALAGLFIDITSAGTGTHSVRKTGEPRYAVGGAVQTSAEPGDNLGDILSACAGIGVYVGGKWRILAGAYRTPSASFNEDDLAGPITMQTRVTRSERFNTVRGTYLSPINDGQPSDFPYVSNATYIAADRGQEISRDMALPLTQRPIAAQRIAKIGLESMRQEISFSADFKLSALTVQAGDVVLIDNDRFGWDQKPFEVTEWALRIESSGDAPIILVRLALRETAEAVYDWNSGLETTIDPAPNTNLPNAFSVAAPSGMALDSEAIATRDGDEIYKIVLSWNPHPDAFVTSGGQFEVQYRRSGATTWLPTPSVPGNLTRADLFTSELGVLYDVRMRAINMIGIASGWSSVTDFAAGGVGGVTDSEDWGEASESVSDSADWGEASESVSD